MHLMAGALAVLVAATVSPGTIHARAAAVLRSSEYQTALPLDPSPFRLNLPMEPIIFLLRALLAATVVVAVIMAATWLARRLRRGAEDAALAPADARDDAIATIPLGTAQQLAAEGRFGEAIHALLLETLEGLSRTARLAPALTSREIVQRIPLAPPAREALGGLVSAVEISHFGGAVPREADYQACLARFHAFVGSYRSAA